MGSLIGNTAYATFPIGLQDIACLAVDVLSTQHVESVRLVIMLRQRVSQQVADQLLSQYKPWMVEWQKNGGFSEIKNNIISLIDRSREDCNPLASYAKEVDELLKANRRKQNNKDKAKALFSNYVNATIKEYDIKMDIHDMTNWPPDPIFYSNLDKQLMLLKAYASSIKFDNTEYLIAQGIRFPNEINDIEKMSSLDQFAKRRLIFCITMLFFLADKSVDDGFGVLSIGSRLCSRYEEVGPLLGIDAECGTNKFMDALEKLYNQEYGPKKTL